MKTGIVVLSLVVGMALPAAASAKPHKHVCGPPAAHHVRCHADVVTDASGNPLVTPGPSGYGPLDLQSAYNLSSASSSAGGGETIAIVDAYDDPNAEADLGVYRSQYGLPPCTTANGCFHKVDQTGGTNYPSGNASWAQEISLDLDMASAICPNCKIRLVEANSNSFANLAAAVDEAAALGATQISNSYGGGEYSSEVTDQSHYNHPGIDITVSSGDNGYGVEFPASSQYVTAVGGTSLVRASNARGWSETAWSGAGSGCSAYVSKPSWQTDPGCSRRTVADVSADADPNTGVAVYDTYGSGGWLVFGGTSVASPIIAGVDALAGGRAQAATPYGSYPYSNAGAFYDITSGSNGSCGGSYLCTAGPGYDGPTGIGTPNGVTPPQPALPANTSPPTITGTPAEYQTLTAHAGTWTGYPAPTFTYQWNRCTGGTCSHVLGATSTTYTLGSSDVGDTITVTVTAANGSGASQATSAAAGPVGSAPAPDFSLSASPSSQTVKHGRSTSYTITVNALNGFKGSVSLSVSGLPSGASGTFSPNPTSSSSTLSVRTSSSTSTGSYTLTITGTSGSLSHSAKVTLTVR
jgi:subtilase family serine protease